MKIIHYPEKLTAALLQMLHLQAALPSSAVRSRVNLLHRKLLHAVLSKYFFLKEFFNVWGLFLFFYFGSS